MKELLDQVRAWQGEGADLGRAVVVRTFGSAPRPEGANLVTTADGRLAGSVSGGCVEGAAFEEIQRARLDGVVRVIRYGISDEQAWDVGLACGGTIDLLVEPFLRPEVVEAAAGPGGMAVVIPLPADAPPATSGPHPIGVGEPPRPAITVTDDGTVVGSTGAAEADAEIARAARDLLARGGSAIVAATGREYFVESFPVAARLVLFGAVQVAMPLARMARELGYLTIVVDGRTAFATRERFPEVDVLAVGWPDEVAEEIGLGPADAVAVLTHDVKFDEPAILEALRRGCRYVGTIGSRKTQAERRARLLAAGVPEADLARLRGPIGLDLGGRAPAEIAVAVMAEIVAERYGGTGLPLRGRSRP
ncbi:MAG TPA: XdhC/CoxI family protein [Patescibacteria group bacterium]|nr:XdhC/CoxI family protein [Patescibacteria group bacterium]